MFDKIKILTFAKGNFIESQNKLKKHLTDIGIKNQKHITDKDLSKEFLTEYDEILKLKRLIIEYFLKALKLAESIQQSWLIFNGAIYIWNNYLPVFRNPINDSRLMPEIAGMLKDYFEVMKNAF